MQLLSILIRLHQAVARPVGDWVVEVIEQFTSQPGPAVLGEIQCPDALPEDALENHLSEIRAEALRQVVRYPAAAMVRDLSAEGGELVEEWLFYEEAFRHGLQPILARARRV